MTASQSPIPPVTAPDLDALTAALDQGTPGPWWVDRDRVNGFDLMRPDGDFLADRMGALSAADAALIVAAVNALPTLVAEVREGRAFAEWLVSLDDDDPESAGRRDRRTVTLNDITGKARAVLNAEASS